MLKGGVIGYGAVGQSMTRYINERSNRARVVAACNRGKDRLEEARKQGLRVTHDVKEMCSWGLDFVMIVSTNYAHHEQVLAAAEAGLHIFCEKPIALELKPAREMVNAVEKAGVATVVNYTMRYSPIIQEMKARMDSGELGEILSFSHTASRAFGLHCAGARHAAVIDAKESGGWIIHHLCHRVDLAYWLLGDYKTVFCSTQSTLPDRSSEEMVFAQAIMKNGAIAQFGDSIVKANYGQTVLTGKKATFMIQTVEPYEFVRLRREDRTDDERIYLPRKIRGSAIEHLFDCIEKKTKPTATIRDAYESLRVCLAMKESARGNKLIDMDAFPK